MQTATALRVLAGLSQPARLAAVRHLVERGAIGAYPGQLAEEIGSSPATLSFHLKELVHAGLIIANPEGRFIRYVLDFDVMNGLVDFLTRNCCGGRADCFPKVSASKPVRARRKAVARRVLSKR